MAVFTVKGVKFTKHDRDSGRRVPFVADIAVEIDEAAMARELIACATNKTKISRRCKGAIVARAYNSRPLVS